MFDSTYDYASYDDGYYDNNSTDYSGQDHHDNDAFDRFDDMAERTIWPWIDDESHDSDNDGQGWGEDYDDSMDGDFDTGMRDAGFGTDEDYGYYGENY